MTASRIGAIDIRIMYRNDLVTKKRADPTNRANKRRALGTPALGAVVWPFKRRNDVLGKCGQNRLGRSRGNEALGKNILASIGVLTTYKLRSINAALACKAARRLGGSTRLIKSDVRSGAALNLMNLFGLDRYIGDDRTEPARRGDDLDITMSETGIIKALGQKLTILLRSVNERSGGHLLGSDLEQEVFLFRHRFYASFWDEALSAEPPATSARYDSQQAFATARTRRM